MEQLLQWLGVFAKFARLPIAAIAITSCFALFAPPGWLTFLGVRQVFEENHTQIGVAFLLSVSTIVASGVRALWLLLSRWWGNHQHHRAVQHSLKTLTNDEKERLQPFIIEGTSSMNYSPADGVAAGLRAKGILFWPTTIGSSTGMAHNLQPPARAYLLKHPGLLTMQGEPSTLGNIRGPAGRHSDLVAEIPRAER
jgi:Super-infection exclusion protein B